MNALPIFLFDPNVALTSFSLICFHLICLCLIFLCFISLYLYLLVEKGFGEGVGATTDSSYDVCTHLRAVWMRCSFRMFWHFHFVSSFRSSSHNTHLDKHVPTYLQEKPVQCDIFSSVIPETIQFLCQRWDVSRTGRPRPIFLQQENVPAQDTRQEWMKRNLIKASFFSFITLECTSKAYALRTISVTKSIHSCPCNIWQGSAFNFHLGT